MPKPISWQGTHGTAPDYRSGHHTLIQSTCLPDGNSYLSKQNVDGMPQAYSLHDLNRRSVFRADGTEHSYYALPESYPLEQATPEPLFSNEFVDVFASTFEQQLYEEEQQETEQSPKCSKANTTACYDSLFIRDVQLPTTVQDDLSGLKEIPIDNVSEEDQQESEQLAKCFRMASENASSEQVQVLKPLSDPDLNIGWSLKLNTGSCNREQLLKCSSKVSAFRNVSDVYVRAGQEESQGNAKLFWEKSICRTTTGHSILFFPWDSGDTKLHVMFTTAAGTTKLQCTNVYKFAMVQILAVKFGVRRAPIFELAIMCSCPLDLGWTEPNATAVLVLATPCSQSTCVAKQSMMLPHSGNSRTNHSFPKLFMQLLRTATTVQVTEQRHPLEFSSMVEMLPNGSEFTDGQLAYMRQGTNISSFEWVRHMVIVLSCWYPSFEMAKLQWDPGIGTPSSIYLWLQGLTARIATEKQINSASFVWDPDTMLLSTSPNGGYRTQKKRPIGTKT